MPIHTFLTHLQDQPPLADVFNPWRDVDPDNDRDALAPHWRTSHLIRYLEERLGHARLLLIGEAPGYQGAKFSGCAMTSERRLLESGEPSPYFSGIKHRTSRLHLSHGKTNPLGCLEPTASIVWPTLLQCCQSHEFVLWNAFAWHPHQPRQPLTNRTPTDQELQQGKATLQRFLALYPAATIIAVGKKSQATLAALGISAYPVRHPANGGATLFRQQLLAWRAANAKPYSAT